MSHAGPRRGGPAVDAFREHAPDKPVHLKIRLSYDTDEDAALEGAYDQWRTNCVPPGR